MIVKLLLILIGYSSGVVVAAGIFALITALGIVPRLIERTNTSSYVFWYENCIILGGIIGTILTFWPFKIPFGLLGAIGSGLFMGMFIGSLIVALAEFINVLPIMNRRLKLKGGIGFIIILLGIGKATGSIIYWIVPGLIQGR